MRPAGGGGLPGGMRQVAAPGPVLLVPVCSRSRPLVGQSRTGAQRSVEDVGRCGGPGAALPPGDHPAWALQGSPRGSASGLTLIPGPGPLSRPSGDSASFRSSGPPPGPIRPPSPAWFAPCHPPGLHRHPYRPGDGARAVPMTVRTGQRDGDGANRMGEGRVRQRADEGVGAGPGGGRVSQGSSRRSAAGPGRPLSRRSEHVSGVRSRGAVMRPGVRPEVRPGAGPGARRRARPRARPGPHVRTGRRGWGPLAAAGAWLPYGERGRSQRIPSGLLGGARGPGSVVTTTTGPRAGGTDRRGGAMGPRGLAGCPSKASTDTLGGNCRLGLREAGVIRLGRSPERPGQAPPSAGVQRLGGECRRRRCLGVREPYGGTIGARGGSSPPRPGCSGGSRGALMRRQAAGSRPGRSFRYRPTARPGPGLLSMPVVPIAGRVAVPGGGPAPVLADW